MDDSLLKERLLRRESVFMLPSAARCAKAASNFLGAVEKRPNDVEASKDDMLRECALFRIEVARTLLAADACEEELSNYEALQKEIDEETNATEEEIKRLREELQAERLVRRRREEYEALAREVNEFPSKRRCIEDITKLEEEHAQLDAMRKGYDEQVETRRRQFSVLLQSIFDLQQKLESEHGTEEDKIVEGKVVEAEESKRTDDVGSQDAKTKGDAVAAPDGDEKSEVEKK